ncbi:helix-turn-helix domain-containing protein [Roseovarius sp. SYSU LYC5161]|uniref:helix-turn-helix domain-containing protein n=1 Tax=Roseovarius halophilus (ex Wu et al. 2025) TaxID=3376060 RepID=UPI00399BCDF3
MTKAAMRSPAEREQMAERLAAGRDEEIADAERRRMNDGFVQVYSKGWARMRELLKETKSQAPLLLYTFIAEHIDADGGVVVADQETICRAIGVSRTTLWRAITFLEERNALLRIVVGGSVSAYALDPTEVWRSWDSAKERAVFRTKTVVRTSAQSDDVKRRMTVMMKEKAGEPELPLDELEHDPETGEVRE